MVGLPRLYAIADRSFGEPVDIGRRLIAGGAKLIQLRDKNASARSLFEQARSLLDLAPRGVSLIVNDRADVALTVGAAGVHLGQTDLPVSAARVLLGAESIVGLSTHSIEEALAAQALPVDYLAAGPIFTTGSKENPAPPIGLAGLEAICRVSRVPVVAIGGICLNDVGAVLAAGAHSVAVIADLLNQGDIGGRTREYLRWLG